MDRQERGCGDGD